MFKQQEQVLTETSNSASSFTNIRIGKLLTDISKNNEKLFQLSKEFTCVQVSIDTSQQNLEGKMKMLGEKFEKERKENINYFKSIEAEDKDLKDKLRDLVNRSKQDNMRFDSIVECENESWSNTEENLKDFLYQRLNIQRVGIEQVQRIG